jgi:hypothetical protein
MIGPFFNIEGLLCSNSNLFPKVTLQLYIDTDFRGVTTKRCVAERLTATTCSPLQRRDTTFLKMRMGTNTPKIKVY